MPENFFGIGAYQHPDAASLVKAKQRPRQKRARPRKRTSPNVKDTSSKTRLPRNIPMS